MTSGTASALAVGVIAAFGLGVWTGTYLTDGSAAQLSPRQQAVGPALSDTATAARAATAARLTPASPTPASRVTRPTVAVGSADLHARLRPVLNRGANLDIAAEGFRDAEQFATVAHAARNTEVPFVLLKHRVLSEGKSLAAAIRDSKPALDASVQVDLAVAQARADIATIRG